MFLQVHGFAQCKKNEFEKNNDRSLFSRFPTHLWFSRSKRKSVGKKNNIKTGYFFSRVPTSEWFWRSIQFGNLQNQ